MLDVCVCSCHVTTAALLSLLKFIITNEQTLLPRMNLFPLATQVHVTILCCVY